ncbi:MAG: penicillin-binding protein 2 [bacterium]
MLIHKDYKARVLVLFLCFFALYLVIIIRLFLLQIYQKDFFKLLATQQHHVSVTLEPERAEILDRRGALLAFNRDVPSAFILPHEIHTAQKTESFLKKYYSDVYKRMKKHPERHFLWLERKLTPERFAWFQKFNLDDIKFIQEFQRFYPYKELANIIGFTDVDNKGIAGIEREYCNRLRGKPTHFMLNKDARSTNLYFDKHVIDMGARGISVTLTIDNKLQFLAHEYLKEAIDEFQAQAGAVLVMDPETGEVIVMANYPTFDPNGKVPDDLEKTKNIIVSECFELGSVMKVFAAMAVLEEGAVGFDEEIDCGGRVEYIDHFKVENWKNLEVLPFYNVISNSSNIGIAKVIKRIDKKYYDHLLNFGFGKKTGLVFSGERDGFVNNPRNWSRSSAIVMSFGYEISATLLQLGVAMSMIANGGYLVKPVLVKEDKSYKRNVARKKIYSDKTIAQVKQILEIVGAKYATIAGYRTMGKTGTARMVVNGRYSNEKHLYTFAGIIEKDDFKRVVITFIKEPALRKRLWASDVAAPLYKRIAEKLVVHDVFNN